MTSLARWACVAQVAIQWDGPVELPAVGEGCQGGVPGRGQPFGKTENITFVPYE